VITGGASGIGRAIVERLERGGAEVQALDLEGGFDVSDPVAWEAVGAVDLACLNAGVVTGTGDIGELSDDAYRRILGANVDGVVFGVRRLARVLEPGSAIVVTASLAGLTSMPSDSTTRERNTSSSASSAASRRNSTSAGFASTRSVRESSTRPSWGRKVVRGSWPPAFRC
jgi:NAD(P)-dependent dehydrogenase (short-subunit alcohol dehydrogenase family)